MRKSKIPFQYDFELNVWLILTRGVYLLKRLSISSLLCVKVYSSVVSKLLAPKTISFTPNFFISNVMAHFKIPTLVNRLRQNLTIENEEGLVVKFHHSQRKVENFLDSELTNPQPLVSSQDFAEMKIMHDFHITLQ